MKKLLKIFIGLVLLGTTALVFPQMPLHSWGVAALQLIKGGITLIIPLIGLILVIIGFNDLKE